jgi:hypothetical protein
VRRAGAIPPSSRFPCPGPFRIAPANQGETNEEG